MIRLALMSTALIGSMAILMLALGNPTEPDGPDFDEVSRTTTVPMTFEPALTVPTAPEPQIAEPVVAAIPTTRPALRPLDLVPEVEVSEPVQTVSRPVTTDVAPQVEDKVLSAIDAMTVGIVKELQSPAAAQAASSSESADGLLDLQSIAALQALGQARKTAPAPKVIPEEVMQTYLVQEGDSLPGIAFRFYGTTVAYLDILSANSELLGGPGDLRTGMQLRIPERK